MKLPYQAVVSPAALRVIPVAADISMSLPARATSRVTVALIAPVKTALSCGSGTLLVQAAVPQVPVFTLLIVTVAAFEDDSVNDVVPAAGTVKSASKLSLIH